MGRLEKRRAPTAKRNRSSALLDLQAHQVRTPNADSVRKYLRKFPEIAKLLPAISERTRTEFGTDAELSLDLYRDPEFQDEYLTLYVRQPLYGADILDRIDRATEAFQKRLERAAGSLLITTDFRPPQSNNGI